MGETRGCGHARADRPAALTFLTMTTKPSFRAEFNAGEGGKTAV
ncbi:MAG: hypothetical protein ACKVW3_06880 [Phycisphaerales bacterium]